MADIRRTVLRGLAVAGLVGLGACSSTAGGESGGNVLKNLVLYGGTTVPPAMESEPEEIYCPVVDVIEGGAALRAVAGDTVRHQFAINQFARECQKQPDGSLRIKVGVEGRVLIGQGGGGGRFDLPLQFVIRRADKVLAGRQRRVPVAIPAGQFQGDFTVVEDGLIVPPQAADGYEILVGLGQGQGMASGPKRARR